MYQIQQSEHSEAINLISSSKFREWGIGEGEMGRVDIGHGHRALGIGDKG
jgi:hypothetical protein